MQEVRSGVKLGATFVETKCVRIGLLKQRKLEELSNYDVGERTTQIKQGYESNLGQTRLFSYQFNTPS